MTRANTAYIYGLTNSMHGKRWPLADIKAAQIPPPFTADTETAQLNCLLYNGFLLARDLKRHLERNTKRNIDSQLLFFATPDSTVLEKAASRIPTTSRCNYHDGTSLC